jgi:branched-subunit amino acid ABC-type transport system permease component
MSSLLAFAFAACSAIAWYAASPHCMWSALRGHPRVARIAGSVLALLSLVSWISVLGGAVGLCAMLASWMLALIVQPLLALFVGSPDADVTATEKD